MPKNIDDIFHPVFYRDDLNLFKYLVKTQLSNKKLLLITSLFFNGIVFAQQKTAGEKKDSINMLQNVEVTGKIIPVNKSLLSTEASASPASVTVLGRDYISKQTVNSYGDLLRPVAGINVTNYQLGGVGYGIEMRGYVTTEHARDIAFFIDGVPQNQSSSIEANGYVDLNPLIPENIRSLEVVRGPFNTLYGDHALGGSIAFKTEDRLPSSILISGGTYGFGRALGTYGFKNGNQSGYVSVEAGRTDGYRSNSKETHINGMAKYSFPLFSGTASVRVQGFGSDFNSAGYLVRADIDAGKISKTTAVNNTDGGSTRVQNFVVNYRGNDSLNYTSATLYVEHHDFIRIRTGTIGGPQREERDNHVWTGGDLRHTSNAFLGKMPILYFYGVSIRADFADETRFVTVARQKVSQNQDRTIDLTTPSVYAQLQFKPVEKLKVTFGARFDEFLYNIKTGPTDASLANARVNTNVNVFTPKVGIAYGITSNINVFANVARGFKSPSGYEENLFNPSLSASKLTSYELGIGGDDASGLYHGLISAYLSDQTGEIQTDPLGNLINFGNTRHTGMEAEGRAGFGRKSGFSLFANYSYVLAKLRNGDATDMYVTNTPNYLGTIGFDYDFGAAMQLDNRLVFSGYEQIVGNKNLNSSGSIQSKAYSRLSGKLTFSRRSWANFKIYVQSSYYPGNGALQEVSFLSGGNILVAPQAPFTLDAGVKIPL